LFCVILVHLGRLAEIVLHSVFFFLQLLNLLEVIIDNAESKSDLSDKSGESASEHTSGPEILALDVGMNRESGQISSGVAATAKDVDSSKPTSSGAHKEFDTRIVLLNLPQAELRLLCSLLAREGYDVAVAYIN
jgi:E3 ubiquitin-protein ligase HUWE1